MIENFPKNNIHIKTRHLNSMKTREDNESQELQ